MAYVYRHIRTDKNIPFYIGIGSDENGKYKRAYQKTKRNSHWKNIVDKTKYEVEILLDDLTWSDACLKEIEFIKFYGRIDLKNGSLVNKTDGGEGTINVDPEIRKIASTKRKPHTLETRKKMSDVRMNMKFSNEHKENLSISQKGNKNRLNKKHSNESKLKMSNSRKGKSPWNKNKHLSEENKQNISNSLKGNIPWNKGLKIKKG